MFETPLSQCTLSRRYFRMRDVKTRSLARSTIFLTHFEITVEIHKEISGHRPLFVCMWWRTSGWDRLPLIRLMWHSLLKILLSVLLKILDPLCMLVYDILSATAVRFINSLSNWLSDQLFNWMFIRLYHLLFWYLGRRREMNARTELPRRWITVLIFYRSENDENIDCIMLNSGCIEFKLTEKFNQSSPKI